MGRSADMGRSAEMEERVLSREEEVAIWDLVKELREEGSNHGAVKLTSTSHDGLVRTAVAATALLRRYGCQVLFSCPDTGRGHTISLVFKVDNAI